MSEPTLDFEDLIRQATQTSLSSTSVYIDNANEFFNATTFTANPPRRHLQLPETGRALQVAQRMYAMELEQNRVRYPELIAPPNPFVERTILTNQPLFYTLRDAISAAATTERFR